MNTVNLIGRLTADPELRHTAGGTPVCTVRLAVNRPRKDGQDQGAVFVDVVSYSRQAEAVAEHLGKGRQVAVTGRLEYRQWEGQDGSPRSKHEVTAKPSLGPSRSCWTSIRVTAASMNNDRTGPAGARHTTARSSTRRRGGSPAARSASLGPTQGHQ